MSARVRLISGPREWDLGSEAVTVPAGVTVVSISGFDSRTVTVDGRRVRLSSGSEGVVVLDLSRSTGYHRIVVDGATYWFGTDDAKLGLAGIEAMLGVLSVGGRNYDPLRVVVRRSTTTLDTVSNRRAVQVLQTLSRLTQEVLASQPDLAARVRGRLRSLTNERCRVGLRADSVPVAAGG